MNVNMEKAQIPKHYQHQFLNICKICKKVFKDKGGLLEHQRLIHSQSISQQVQQLAMKRFNNELHARKQSPQMRNFTGKDERFNNGTSVDPMKIVKSESYATLQKPPASLKPKLQSRMSLEMVGSSKKFLSGSDDHEEWKREPEKEKEGMIISARVAESTAACYSPPGNSQTQSDTQQNQHQKELNQNSNQKPTITSNTNKIVLSPLLTSPPQANQIKVNSQLLSRIKQGVGGVSMSSMVATLKQQQQNNFKGIPRIPIPKLMSKTKAQFQILKSQAMRPKVGPRNSANNALPRDNIAQLVLPNLNNPPKLTKQMDIPTLHNEAFKNPPQLLREVVGKKQAVVVNNNANNNGVKRKPTGPTLINNKIQNNNNQPFRGRPPKSVANNNKQETVRRESLNENEEQSSSEKSEDDEHDEYEFKPPPTKKPKPFTSPIKNRSKDDVRIFGKEYKCPPMDKHASFLNKKGVRVWICLVCEETEEEISRGPMICCDRCEDWYHFSCVGIEDEPPEDEKWYCKRCIFKNLQTKVSETKPKNPATNKSKKVASPPAKTKRGPKPRGRKRKS